MDCRVTPLPVTLGVLRPGLLQLLSHSERYALTLLLAPAGSGKSTLLAQWLQHESSTRHVLLNLQARDNDPVRFFRRLLAAIRQQVSDFDPSWFDPIGAEFSRSPVVAGELLAEALERVGGNLQLVFDDFHHLTDSVIVDALAALLDSLPDNVRLLIASRKHPGFSLTRLKLQDRLLCIDQHDLRLSAEQVQQLNRHLGGPPLSDDYLRSLQGMTEGWVAGVKVALLAFARYGITALECFSGTQPEIVDYFGEVVLKQLAPELREFFLGSALFDQFDGALCDHVLQRTGSALLLEQLAEQHLFMLPVEQRPGAYRYHALLQDFLGARLRIESPETVLLLRRRATEYYQRQGDVEAALQQAQATADQDLFIAVLERAGSAWVGSGRFELIRKWYGLLSDEQLQEHPPLLVTLIAALTLSRRFHQAEFYLQMLQQLVAQGRAPQLGTHALQFMRLTLNLFQFDSEADIQRDAPSLLDERVCPETRVRALTALAYHDLMGGRLSSSLRRASEAKVLLEQGGNFFMASYIDLVIALCHRAAGRASEARQAVYADYQRTERHEPAWINRATAMVVALYEQNQLAAAQQLCEDLLTEVSSSSATEAIATVHIILSRLLNGRQLPGRAQRLLDQLLRILELGRFPRFVSQVAQESLRQALLAGKPAALESAAQRFGLAERLQAGEWDTVRPYEECWERYGLATAYWLIGRGNAGRAVRVLKVLAESLRGSEMHVRSLVVEINLWLHSPELASDSQRVRVLRQLVARYGVHNLTRTILDEAPGFGPILAQLQQAGLLQIPARYCELYAEFFQAGAVARQSINPRSVLTDKELEVFHGLLAGWSNGEISQRAGIALSTTKWHLKNIYSKLQVASRTEAILAAREYIWPV